jgi:hypothetical protein
MVRHPREGRPHRRAHHRPLSPRLRSGSHESTPSWLPERASESEVPEPGRGVLARRSPGPPESWPAGILARRSPGPPESWPAGILARRNPGPPESWPAGILARRNPGPPESWPAGILVATTWMGPRTGRGRSTFAGHSTANVPRIPGPTSPDPTCRVYALTPRRGSSRRRVRSTFSAPSDEGTGALSAGAPPTPRRAPTPQGPFRPGSCFSPPPTCPAPLIEEK